MALMVIVIFILIFIIILLSLRIFFLKSRTSEIDSSTQHRNLLFYFDYLVKYGNDIIILSDSTMKIIGVNDLATTAYGYSRDEFLMLSIQDLRAPDTLPDIKNQFNQLNSGTRLVFETKHQKKNGTIFIVEVSSHLIEIDNKKYNKSIVRDISNRKALEHQLLAEKYQLRTIIDSSPASIWFKDTKNNFIHVNEAAAKIAKRSVKEIEGKPTREIFPVESDKYFSDDLEVINSGKPKLGIIESVTTENEVRWVSTDKIPWTNPNGIISGVIAFALDITDRIQSIEKINMLAHAIKSVSECVSITDMNDNILFINDAFLQTYGYSKEELIGNNINIVRSSTMSTTDNNILTETLKGGWKGEITNHRKDGFEFPVNISTSIIKDDKGNAIALIGVASDITELKKSTEELIKAKEKAEEINRLKSFFLDNLSHELRTPMIGILGFSEILREKSNDPQFCEMIDTISSSAKRLLNTLELLLDLSSLVANNKELILENLDIDSSIKSIVKSFEGTAKKKGLYLNLYLVESHFAVKLDGRVFEQIMNNLLNNAIKFTNRGGIEVIVQSEILNDKPWIVIKVVDTGIGIPPESLQLIFEEFRQASEGRNRSYEGTGLGLSITKRTVELMKGTISVVSTKGIGSTFTIHFPAIETNIYDTSFSVNIRANENIPQAKNFKDKILIVEDDKLNSDFIKVVLKKYYSFDLTDDAKSAINLASQNKYSLIFMDIKLGYDMNGIQAASEIRKLPGYEKIPMVAVTAYAMQFDKDFFLSQGFNYYLSKPYSKNDLLKLTYQILSSS